MIRDRQGSIANHVARVLPSADPLHHHMVPPCARRLSCVRGAGGAGSTDEWRSDQVEKSAVWGGMFHHKRDRERFGTEAVEVEVEGSPNNTISIIIRLHVSPS